MYNACKERRMTSHCKHSVCCCPAAIFAASQILIPLFASIGKAFTCTDLYQRLSTGCCGQVVIFVNFKGGCS